MAAAAAFSEMLVPIKLHGLTPQKTVIIMIKNVWAIYKGQGIWVAYWLSASHNRFHGLLKSNVTLNCTMWTINWQDKQGSSHDLF
jgi:hypothetical protein